MDNLDPRSADLSAVQTAYSARAAEYTALFGSADKASVRDRALIAAWATTIDGPVLDAGCGPGHWTSFLHSLGLQVEGVDATSAFVQRAGRTFPEIPFRLDDLRTLDRPAASLGGILAWFSLIHLDPSEIPHVLRRFTRALRPGGTILIGYFSGPALTPFDHAVVSAWAWPPPLIAQALEAEGLEILSHDQQPQPSGRVFADIAARRPVE